MSRPDLRILTDAQIGEILTSTESIGALAQRFKCGYETVRKHRRLETKLAVRIAQELGLLSGPDKVRGWASDGSVVTATARQVAR